MINRVVLVGRITKDIDLKYTQSGVAVARFTLAVNRPFTNGQGEREADFINCVAWRKQAENMANFLGKGSLIGVDGRIQTSNFEGQDGKRVFMTEVMADSVQFLESRRDGQGGAGAAGGQGGANTSGSNYNPGGGQQQTQGSQYSSGQYSRGQNDDPFNTGGPIEVSDDDLPF